MLICNITLLGTRRFEVQWLTLQLLLKNQLGWGAGATCMQQDVQINLLHFEF
jgi:hypothetical protein